MKWVATKTKYEAPQLWKVDEHAEARGLVGLRARCESPGNQPSGC